ncbi:YpbB family protein [Virgibacillus halodenitrificans]|uniref:helix-turn-helix domain-containing protein n=1 Tax=Virgibacillus halodenitrificans TaxID=1482 RepID=UPI001F442DD1|nr:helix-turn-helix domain-containing protein [Virgibacillus halodenitrificans]
MILEALLLTCIKRLNGERSSSAIFHILKGKRSIQTIQDIHMYRLTEFYSSAKNIRKADFNKEMQKLLRQNLIKKTDVEPKIATYLLTELGNEWLGKNIGSSSIHYFNGLTYANTSLKFYSRLVLLIQTFTNTTLNNYSFLPIVNDPETERWVKKIYSSSVYQPREILNQMYEELKKLFLYFTDEEAHLFIDRLTGFDQYGLSLDQLANKYGKSYLEVQLLITAMTQNMLQVVITNKKRFPFLTFIAADLQTENTLLTNSAIITNRFLQKGYDIPAIAQIRKLKYNTIYDHIVEIAIHDRTFPIEKYVNKKNQQSIMQAIQQTKSYMLKDIKENINHEVSYFEIRLVLSLIKNTTHSGDKRDK